MDTCAHVFNVDIPKMFAPFPSMGCRWYFTQAVQMANIECKTECRMIHALKKCRKTFHGIDEHSRFRFKCESLAFGSSIIGQVPAFSCQSVEQNRGRFLGDGRAGPEADGIGI